MNSKLNTVLWIPRVLFLLYILFFLYLLILRSNSLETYVIIFNFIIFGMITTFFYLTFSIPIGIGVLIVIRSILGLPEMNKMTSLEIFVLCIYFIAGCLFIILPLCFKSKKIKSDKDNLISNENLKEHSQEKIECPICQNTDSVILLSTAYLHSLPLSEKGIPDITKSNENKLSALLAPPREPRKYGFFGWIILGIICVYLLAIFIAQFYQNTSRAFIFIGNGLFCLSWIFTSLSNVIDLIRINQYTDKNIFPMYQKALLFWNGLYYCEEDSLVFHPISNKSTDLENLRTYIVTETGYNDSLYQSLRMKPEKQTGEKKGISELGLVGLVALFMIHFFLTTYLIGTFASPVLFRDRSMNPTIKKHSFILNARLNYFAKNPKRGDIIVFHQKLQGEDAYFMQRVIALPGETVGWKNGEIRVDGKKLDEPYLFDKLKNNEMETNVFDHVFLKKDEFFVIGDDRSTSTDSRSFGPVQRDNILGKVYFFVNFSKE